VQRETAEHPPHVKDVAALVNLARLGLVSLIDSVNRLLEKPSHQLIGGFEYGYPQQGLQLRNQLGLGTLGFKPGDQLLDFLILGQEDMPGDFFFFEVAMLWRVSAMTSAAYCWVSCW
jgi:hypothetical protein